MDNTVTLRPNYDSDNIGHVPLASFNPTLSQLGVYMPELPPSAPRARYVRPPSSFPKNYVVKVQVRFLFTIIHIARLTVYTSCPSSPASMLAYQELSKVERAILEA